MSIPEVFENVPHRRYNPLLDEWVLVAPHRAKRPWSGRIEKTLDEERPKYDPGCYLCPRNTRSSGHANPDYQTTFVFENDFPSLLHENLGEPSVHEACNGLIRGVEERGICRVICFSPRHDLTLAEMDLSAIGLIVDLWHEQYVDLGSKDFISHVLIFENKGALMGCSNPHPHGQIWANESIPSLPASKIDAQVRYFKAHNSPLLMDYLDWEKQQGERTIYENEAFISLVPFWAVWPFETMILPKRHVTNITDLDDAEKAAWAEILKDLAIRYDNVFQSSFPYSMGINQLPTDGQAWAGLTLHQAFFPPLLRSASIKKFQVGYEMSAEPQRDITPEQAVNRLRECGGKHYKEES
ncbi:UDP-glucose--hexose-1-phosphate uridylyltransferase [bacterium]|nr:UDP-glucose--hexose-1-phosphate uridylyltransferase [bacterium]